MIELFKFGALGKVCDPSPFCVKVETYLRMTDQPYEVHTGAHLLRSSPKSKLPYIRDGGKIVADSTFILHYLEARQDESLDGHLTPEQQAIAHGMTKMIDENLYWTLVHGRWILDHNWVIISKLFFGSLPFPLKLFVPNMVRKNVRRRLKEHGIGRHSSQEITEIGSWDLKALSDFLGNKTYFFGDKPSTLDAAVFGFMSQMVLSDAFSAPIIDVARSHANLVRHTHAIQDKYFPELV
ncbi:glutathione S-transferase family protein [Paremcibacter congregatus]|uniref:Glutathione S-transferase n=1 Tax=Paremcibacter congregatus TaxID=2043170 RepID=A0A2G4YPZ0_9PROT|nr:glutathione S-transferase family protein [Paremcibacter congregatus]PHZ84391.1 glutathione S-transferase [Paremcibacter congregatus]QDE28609.1 glutathione S-transferase family protein [Paremcibacter congregatus]